jgi:hypothetical protein
VRPPIGIGPAGEVVAQAVEAVADVGAYGGVPEQQALAGCLLDGAVWQEVEQGDGAVVDDKAGRRLQAAWRE